MISVIIPVYNVEKYISRCIESLLQQTYQNFELLLINDGSTDRSGTICDAYSEIDSRIKVFHNDNVGFGLVRNYGLKHARGAYICFVDSDDTVAPKYLENLFKELELSNANAVFSGFKSIGENDNVIYTKTYEEISSNLPLENIGLRMIGSLPGKSNAILPVVWGGIYSHKIIKDNNLTFLSEREFVAEDLLFNLKYLSHCRTARLLSKSDYNYRIRDNSITRKFDMSILEKQNRALNKLEEEWNDKFSPSAKISLRLSKNFLIIIRGCLIGAVRQGEIKKEYKYISNITGFDKTRDVVNNYPISSLSFKQRVFVRLIKGRHNFLLFIIGKLGLL